MSSSGKRVTGRGATFYVAANDATALSKAMADYVCDNALDDVEINGAIAALPGVGGTVQLSEGTFTINNIVGMNKPNMVLRGMGRSATTIAPQAGAAGANSQIVHCSQPRCELRDLTVAGNRGNNASATGMTLVYFSQADCIVDNVRVTNSRGMGLVFESSSSGGVINNVLADDNSSYGFQFTGTTHIITNCVSRSNFNAGWNLSSSGTKAIGCFSYSNTGSGYILSGGSTQMQDCRSASNTIHGVDVANHDNSIMNCEMINNGQHGIHCNGYHRTHIVGNRISDNGAALASTYWGIWINSDDCYIEGNLIRQGTLNTNKIIGAIAVTGGARPMIGTNEYYSSGGSQILETAGTRRMVKLLVSQTYGAVWPDPGTDLNAGSWTPLGTAVSFTVLNSYSRIQITVKSTILVGTLPQGNTTMARIMVDGTAWQYYAYYTPTAGQSHYVPGTVLSVHNLAAGAHTASLQIWTGTTCKGWMRANSFEQVTIDVEEFTR